jgi:hypothetical protein
VLKSHVGRGSFPQRLKPPFENKVFIAAVNRCATQKQEQRRVFQQTGLLRSSLRCPRWLLTVLESGFTSGGAKFEHEEAFMPKYVIEREIPNVGKLTPQELQGVSQKSCGVLQKLGPQVQWVESFVTDDKIYCVYIAPNEEMIREHARQGGFPANRISAVRSMIGPTTAEG